MSFCRYCGNKLNDGDKVCGNCGNEVKPKLPQTTQLVNEQPSNAELNSVLANDISISKPKKSKMPLIITSLVICLAAIIGTTLYFLNNENDKIEKDESDSSEQTSTSSEEEPSSEKNDDTSVDENEESDDNTSTDSDTTSNNSEIIAASNDNWYDHKWTIIPVSGALSGELYYWNETAWIDYSAICTSCGNVQNETMSEWELHSLPEDYEKYRNNGSPIMIYGSFYCNSCHHQTDVALTLNTSE